MTRVFLPIVLMTLAVAASAKAERPLLGVPESPDDRSVAAFSDLGAWFGIEGLRRYEYEEDAQVLAEQLFENLDGVTEPGVPLRENYHPLTGEGRNAEHFSWTAAHLLMLALDFSLAAEPQSAR